MEHTVNKFGAIIPKRITQSYLKFATEIHHSEILIILLFFGGEYIWENIEEVREKLAELYKDPGNEVAENITEKFKSGELDEHLNIENYQDFYGQMSYARAIDNVLTYFKDILGEVIIKTPKILKSKETERLDFILNFDNINDLKIALSEKKIESLFYAVIDKIEDYFSQRLGVKLFKTENEKKEFSQAIKNRNLIVHNRGIISKEYLKEFPDCLLNLGDRLRFEYTDISRVNIILMNFVARLDFELTEKFSLDSTVNY
jgi:hypothetical protein